jgi:uncharacterized protein YciI
MAPFVFSNSFQWSTSWLTFLIASNYMSCQDTRLNPNPRSTGLWIRLGDFVFANQCERGYSDCIPTEWEKLCWRGAHLEFNAVQTVERIVLCGPFLFFGGGQFQDQGQIPSLTERHPEPAGGPEAGPEPGAGRSLPGCGPRARASPSLAGWATVGLPLAVLLSGSRTIDRALAAAEAAAPAAAVPRAAASSYHPSKVRRWHWPGPGTQ